MQPLREITDRYLPEETLSSDSRFTVYTATDSQAGGRVAVELVDASRGAPSGIAGRFLDAVARMGRLRNSSLPPVIDGGVTQDGELFLVRESVAGRPFETLGGESPGQIVSLLLQVIGALEALAHERLFHGALSAETLWVAPGTDRARAQVTGLGYAAWLSSQPNVDFELGLRDDVRDLAAVASRLFGATVANPASPSPGVQLPLAIAFELEEADTLRDLLEQCLRRDSAQRPDSYAEVRSKLCEALWGEPQESASRVEESGAPPARLTFTTVPEYTLVQAMDDASAEEPEAEGEITKVVLLEELAPEPSQPVAFQPPAPAAFDPASSEPVPPALPEPEEILTPVSFVPTGEGTEIGSAALAVPAARAPAAAVQATSAGAPEVAPPAAPPAASTPTAASRSPVQPSAASPPTGRRRGRLIPLAVAAVVLFLAAAALLVAWRFVSGRGEGEPVRAERPIPPPAAEPSEETAAVAATTPEVLDARIEAALAAFLGDDPAEARRLLDEIPPAEQSAFSPLECEAVAALSRSLDLTIDEQALAGLTRGFADGDLARLQRALRSIAGREEAFLVRYPQLADEITRAQRAVALSDRARAAAREGRSEEVLRATGVLIEMFPAWQGGLSLRETAAVTIENEADLLFEQGRYEQALERLAALSAEWPDREGLDRRDQLIRTRRVAERDVGELLTAAQRAGEDGRPDDGLALLSGVHATRLTAPRMAEIRGELEQQLADLDREEPRIAALDDGVLEFGRDETARIVFRAGDDFRVDRVRVQGRSEGSPWTALPHRRRSGDGRDGEYEVEVEPDFHANKPVEYFVTVTDVSGQTASLGSESAPLEIRRKRWFRRLLPR